MKSLIENARRILAIPSRNAVARPLIADTSAIGLRELLTGRIDTHPRWVRRLPAAMLAASVAAFSSWGREYVVGVLWLAGFALLAVGCVILVPLAMAAAVRATTLGKRGRISRPDDLDRILTRFDWLWRSLGWIAFAGVFLTVLLTGPTARATTICLAVGWALSIRGFRAWQVFLGMTSAALLIRAGFSEVAYPSTFADAASWVALVALVGAVLTDAYRPWLEVILRAFAPIFIVGTIVVALLVAPVVWSIAAVALIVLAVRQVTTKTRQALIAGAVVAAFSLVIHLAAGRADSPNKDLVLHWFAIALAAIFAIVIVHVIGWRMSGPGRLMRRIAAAGVILGFFGLARDWDRSPNAYLSTPPVVCTSIHPVEALPAEERSGQHKIYDIKLDRNGQVLWFCDKFGRRIGQIEVGTGEFRWLDRFDMMPERLIVDESAGSVTAFLKEPFKGNGVTADFDSVSLNLARTCPMGHWVDFVPSGEPGRFIAIHEMAGRLFEMSMDPCGLRSVEIATRLPYDLIATDAGQRYFVSGWFYSSVLSVVDRNQYGEFGEARDAWLGPFSLGMASDDAQRSLFVARPTAWAIDVIDMDTQTRRRRLPALPWIRALAAAPDVGLLFAANFFTGQVVALDAASGELVATWQGPVKEARTILWDSERKRLFVTGRSEILRCEFSELSDRRDLGLPD